MNIIVIALDFWDNYIPIAHRLKLLMDKLGDQPLGLLLFNYPSQAFTLTDPARILTNHEGAKCIDQLLYYLDSEGQFNLATDRLHFFGIGFGANVSLMYSKSG